MSSKLPGRIAAAAVAIVMATACTSCNLVPTKEEKYKLTVSTNNVMDSYAFTTVEYGDVTLDKVISAQYARLNEEKLSFEISGRKVGNVYVQDGDDVEEGQLLASLDVSSQQDRIVTYSESIRENELLIKQQNELIDFYNKRLGLASTSLPDRETYILARQECEEKKVDYQSKIDYYNEQIANCEAIISKADLYAPTRGTIANIREDISSWTTVAGTTVITLIDTSICAFTATVKETEGIISLGDSVVVDCKTVRYPATVTEIDPESGKVVFELDEPDYSLSVGLRGDITINLGEKHGVMRVPLTSVYGDDDGRYVYRLSDSGVREMVPIETGLIGNSYAEVVSGLEIGEAVILRSK